MTNFLNYDILITNKGKETLQTRKAFIMKKIHLTAILDILNGISYSDEMVAELKDELSKELNKGAEVKAKNAEAYEAIHDLIVSNLADAPCTCAELYEVIKSKLPEGMGKGKVQYALTHLWQDEIVKIEGKPNTYRRA